MAAWVLLSLVLLAAPAARAAPATRLPDWSFESDQSEAWLGWSAGSAGDVNGDGYDDVIVGAHQYDLVPSLPTNPGVAFVIHGGAGGLLAFHAWSASGADFGQLGVSVAGAGDVNGDGYDDVIVGEDQYLAGNGLAHVFHGSAAGLSASPNRILGTTAAGARLGYAVDGAGDVNGDDFDDVVVGSVFYSNGQANEGRVSVYLGSSSGIDPNAFWHDESNQGGAQHGVAVAGAGDVNGDDFDDIIVGANLFSGPEGNEGRAVVYLGSASGLTTGPTWRIEPNVPGAILGEVVAGAGDVNQDGYDDVLVSAYGFDGPAGVNVGRAYLYLGGAAGLTLAPGWPVIGDQDGGALYGVGGVGDVNGDTYPDVAVGALWYDGLQPDSGRVYIYPGGPSGASTTPIRLLETNSPNGAFGKTVDGADVNGDGAPDVIASAYAYDGGSTNEGAVFAFTGGGASPEYGFHRILDFSEASITTGSISPALNANGDVAFANSFSPFPNVFEEDIRFLPRGKPPELLAADWDFATNYSYVQLDALNAAGTVLFSGNYDPPDPNDPPGPDFFVKTWRADSGALAIVDHSDDGNPTPDLNEAGEIVLQLGGQLRRLGSGGLEALAPCAQPGFFPKLDDAGQLAFSCGAGLDAVLFLGTAAPFAPAVTSASFTPAAAGAFDVHGMADTGALVFSRLDGTLWRRSASGTLGAVPGPWNAASMNDAETLAVYNGTSIDVRSAPAHHVIAVGDAIGPADVTLLAMDDDSLNAHGQIAFHAILSDGSNGLFLATPLACDPDGDGFCDAANDNCPGYPNTDQRDADGDGVGNACDNCPLVKNPGQEGAPYPGRGTACPACASSGPDLPICQDLVVGTSGQSFVLPPFDLETLPPRPLLYAYATGTPATLSAQLTLDCTGGTPHPGTFFCGSDPAGTTIFQNSDDGLILNQVYLCYLEDPLAPGEPHATGGALEDATCVLTVTAQGVETGTLHLVIDSATDRPKASAKVALSGTTTTAPTPDEIPFVQEGYDYRFLDPGEGPLAFGVCDFETPEPTDFMEISYSTAPQPVAAWDCCTFHYKGADGLVSEVGQIMVNQSGASPPPPDTDMDGYLDPCDNCPNVENDQSDGGGVGTTEFDQIGDICQCGHVFGGGAVDEGDVLRIREHMAGLAALGPVELARCSVIGAPTECGLRTAAVIRRQLEVPPRGPFVQQVCTAAQ